MNKRKIINDPVYGFIHISSDLIFDLINHPIFQRLRRIKQLGLADMVYPGAIHTRFHHALGALHLMGLALTHLKDKGISISEDEYEAACIAILLHDIGHGPFSHALEHSLLQNVKHEEISLELMRRLNEEMKGKLTLAIDMFTNSYSRKFFHQLVSSQLDLDRMDYLQRDCFFTGVSEGTIGSDRIIKMIHVVDDSLVVEEKGIYSVENFLNSRRFMYWQVYLHKTTVSAERLLISICKRAKDLVLAGEHVPSSPDLAVFLQHDLTIDTFKNHPSYQRAFYSIDDYDVVGAIKYWKDHPDFVLSTLSRSFLERRLWAVTISSEEIPPEKYRVEKNKIMDAYQLDEYLAKYFIHKDTISNEAYVSFKHGINMLKKDGSIVDAMFASELPNIMALSKIVVKHYICHPKNVYL